MGQIAFSQVVGAITPPSQYSFLIGAAASGWTSLTVVVVIFGSANLLGIGVLGAYLAQIFDEIKARPEFLVAERLRGEA